MLNGTYDICGGTSVTIPSLYPMAFSVFFPFKRISVPCSYAFNPAAIKEIIVTPIADLSPDRTFYIFALPVTLRFRVEQMTTCRSPHSFTL
jgi:hypothetical protein